MKKLFTIISMLLLCAAASFAQAPQKFSFTTTVSGANGKSIAGQELTVTAAISRGAGSRAVIVYKETHKTIVSDMGTVNLEIGGGTLIEGNFTQIDWSDGPYYVMVDGKSISVVSQLLSVPYAIQAASIPDELIDERLKHYGVFPEGK